MSEEHFSVLDNEIMKINFVINSKNLLLWPLIRSAVLSEILRINNKSVEPHARHPKFSIRNFGYIFNTVLYAPHKHSKNFDIIFYVPARGRLFNKNFNIYSDYYSNIGKKPLVIDIGYRGYYRIPDNINNFSTGDFPRLESFIYSKIKNLFFKDCELNIEKFIDFLRGKDFFKESYNKKIKTKLYEFYQSYDHYNSYNLNIFRKLNPKIIFVNGGSYGQYNSILIKTAKEKGIKTAEFQHGNISKEHFIYNYGDKILKSEEYKKYLPDYILTYGDYWNKQMNTPCEKITIGAPHFYESMKKYTHTDTKKKTILIVSQGMLTSDFVKIASYLAEELKGYKIIFKLHPGEVPFEKRYKILYKYSNIHVAKSGDIYQFIAECEHIVACFSTTIFEAIGFNKNIYVFDNKESKKHIPEDIGIRFKEKEELKDLIIKDIKEDKKYDLKFYFNQDWEENYRNFLREKVNL